MSLAPMQKNFQKWPLFDDILIFGAVFRPLLEYFITFLTQNFQKKLVRRTLSWLLSFKAFEKIPRSQIIKTSSKRGHFCKFLCIGAIPFIVAHHGFHHSMRKCLKYLGYQGFWVSRHLKYFKGSNYQNFIKNGSIFCILLHRS